MRSANVIFTILLAVTAAGQAQQPPSREGFLDGAGGHLYYQECGSGRGMILLHDGLLHSAVWDDVWPALCAKYHVVRYDRRGYGRSTAANAPFSQEEDLLRVMRHAGMSRATLVGSSSGTALAIDFAIAHPESAAALFLIGPVVHGMRSSDFFAQRGNAANAPLAKDDVAGAARNWADDRFQIGGDHPLARKKIFDLLVANPQNLKIPGQYEIRPDPPTSTRLAELRTPTLMIVGERDIADVHAFAGAVQAAAAVVRREVWAGDGHLIELEEPAAVVARLETFVAVVERKVVKPPVAVLRKYSGAYRLGGSLVAVAMEERQLVLKIGGDAPVPLFAETDSHFYVRTTGTDVQFERDTHGRVAAMVITSPGGPPVRCPRES